MNTASSSLLNDTIAAITSADSATRACARQRLEQLAIPHWALGQLQDLAEDLAAMCATMHPCLQRKMVVVMAADHGIVSAGVSKFPQEVTREMVRNFCNEKASINALARQCGAAVTVVDVGVAADLSDLSAFDNLLHRKIAPGSANFAQQAAMSRHQAEQALEVGITVAQQLGDRVDIFATGDMGIGNTSPSSAIIATICRRSAAEVTGRGTGLDDAALQRKIAVLEQALKLHQPDPDDAVDVLAKVGGFEIGAIAGLILGSAAQGKPVVIDGVISSAAALLAANLAPASRDYMIAGHRSVEQGQHIALQHLDKQPLLDLNLRLGEGTGAALAFNIVDAAVAVLTEVATFAEAAVSGPEKR